MRVLFVSIILCFCFGRLNAQQDQYVFQAVKYRLLDYGQEKRSAASSPIRVILNLRDSTILLETSNSDILDFTSFNHQFSIRRNMAAAKGIQAYGTSEGYIFTIYPKRRMIMISKQGVRPQFQALWLEEIENL